MSGDPLAMERLLELRPAVHSPAGLLPSGWLAVVEDPRDVDAIRPRIPAMTAPARPWDPDDLERLTFVVGVTDLVVVAAAPAAPDTTRLCDLLRAPLTFGRVELRALALDRRVPDIVATSGLDALAARLRAAPIVAAPGTDAPPPGAPLDPARARDSGASPTYLDVHAETIPAALQALPAVLWRATPNGTPKADKVPYQVADPDRTASSTWCPTWGRFGDALDAYQLLRAPYRDHPTHGPLAGLGLVLLRPAEIVCIDLDRVLRDGVLDPRAQRIVTAGNSWTEISPSGTGLHIFGYGCLARAIKGVGVEVYTTARFMALTGHHWPGTPATLRVLQPYLDRLVAREAPPPRPAWTGASAPPPDDLVAALCAKLAAWGLSHRPARRWQDGYLVELARCPWAAEHTTGPGGAIVLIRASGAFDFVCQHAHCAARGWRAFRARMETAA